MSIADQFGMNKRRKNNGDPPTLPAVRSPSLEDLSEDARRYFLKVEDQRLANEAMTAEIGRKDAVIMRLEAELDLARATLAAVTADRDTYLRVVTELNTKADSIAQLVLDWGTSIRNAARPPAPPVVDMDAMQAAVESKDV